MLVNTLWFLTQESYGSLRSGCAIFILDERRPMKFCVAAVGLLSKEVKMYNGSPDSWPCYIEEELDNLDDKIKKF